MAKIIATSFGAALMLFGLWAFASPTLLGTHCSPLSNVLHLLLGAALVWTAQKAGASLLFWACAAGSLLLLLWGLAGLALGRPAASTLQGMPPDLGLLILIPGVLESGRIDHVLHLLFGVALGTAAVAGAAETPFRLKK
jgi:hypothetical protein